MNTLLTLFLLPLIVLLQLILLLNEAIFSIIKKYFIRKKEFERDLLQKPKKIKKASIVILNWNGKHLLQKHLPSVIKAMKFCKLPSELIVIDNGSNDDSVAFIKQKYPLIRVLPLKENIGFAKGNNKAIDFVKGDIIVFLNNDMKVDENFLPPLINGFKDERIFAVTSQIFFPKNKRREETGKTLAKWKFGQINLGHDKIDNNCLDYMPVFWASGGSCAVDAKKFKEIGGFDTLYTFYMEDVDISYQAWKRGWQSLLATKSIVYHEHRASSKIRFGESYINTLIEKNKFLFIWKNITDFKLVISHILLLPIIINNKLAEFGIIKGFNIIFRTLIQFPEALIKRSKNKKHYVIPDKTVFKISKDLFEYKQFFWTREKKKRENLNLLFIVPYIPSEKVHAGGQRMYKMISGLAKRHKISLIIPEIEYKSEYKNRIQIEKEYIAKLKSICKKIKLYKKHSLSRLEKFLSQAHMWPLLEYKRSGVDKLIKEFLAEDQFDAILYEYSLTGTILPRNLKEAKILTDHESAYLTTLKKIKQKKNPFEKFNLWCHSILQKNLLKKIYNNFDRVIFASKTDEQLTKKIAPKIKSKTIPMGIDASYFRPNGNPKSNNLVFCGSFSHEPNIEAIKYFIKDIWPKAKSDIKDLKLYIVGNLGKEKLNHHSKTDKDIVITDWVKDVRPYLDKCQIFINPIITGAGMRGKILDAMTMGKPVISTKLGAAGIDATHKKNIWIADTPEKFAKGITELLRNKNLRKSISENARKLVIQKHDWDILVKNLDNTIFKTIEEKRKSHV